MICPSCKFDNKDGVAFCANCGTKMSQDNSDDKTVLITEETPAPEAAPAEEAKQETPVDDSESNTTVLTSELKGPGPVPVPGAPTPMNGAPMAFSPAPMGNTAPMNNAPMNGAPMGAPVPMNNAPAGKPGKAPKAPKQPKAAKSGASTGTKVYIGFSIFAILALVGVLVYGIPEFRLPKEAVVAKEVENVKNLGVKIETNVVVGKAVRIDELMAEGFEAVFIGSGAGLPRFMGIPGENANGVFSANEYLTRSNLMKAFKEEYATPIVAGTKVAVVGGGNVAMDAARTALRLGAEVHIVYRRSEEELPARVEEVHHAKEEGIIFDLLTNPVEILKDENGWVSGIKCIRMELGEPDDSGRISPVEKAGSEFDIEVDTVIMSLGTSPNPLISSTTAGLEVNRRRCIVAEEETGATTKDGVYAGGDAVTGAATVILAMGAGKTAAKAMDEYIKSKNQ